MVAAHCYARFSRLKILDQEDHSRIGVSPLLLLLDSLALLLFAL